MIKHTSPISKTAHYTAYVWYQYGLADSTFVTKLGEILYYLELPFILLGRWLAGVDFHQMLVFRHREIDQQLEQAIAQGYTQIVEIACGLSSRGVKTAAKYGDQVTYYEGDLPSVIQIKEAILESKQLKRPNHQLLDCDLLDAENSLAAMAKVLDPSKKTICITEGLINYLPPAVLEKLWSQIAVFSKGFPQTLYLCDNFLNCQGTTSTVVRWYVMLLKIVTKGHVSTHFTEDAGMSNCLTSCGFENPVILSPLGRDSLIRVISASGTAQVKQ